MFQIAAMSRCVSSFGQGFSCADPPEMVILLVLVRFASLSYDYKSYVQPGEIIRPLSLDFVNGVGLLGLYGYM